jgi:UDP-N-acetylmuramoyl-tripeptide--D-alanyl-D-alanine ligase
VAAAGAVGVVPTGRVELALRAGRGERARLGTGVTLIDDCYNANPMSMRAALEDLAMTAERERSSRRVAVLGDMLELGKDERDFHVEIGEHAARAGVELLVTVGPRAAAMSDRFAGTVRSVADAPEAAELVPTLLRTGDVVLVKGSRGVGLELVCRALRNGGGAA